MRLTAPSFNSPCQAIQTSHRVSDARVTSKKAAPKSRRQRRGPTYTQVYSLTNQSMTALTP
jgi:hypothetical protein